MIRIEVIERWCLSVEFGQLPRRQIGNEERTDEMNREVVDVIQR
jgi:hypothetical protein